MYIVFILIIYIIILYLNELEFGLVRLNELGLELELVKRLVKKLVKLNEPSPSFKSLNELELQPKYQAQ